VSAVRGLAAQAWRVGGVGAVGKAGRRRGQQQSSPRQASIPSRTASAAILAATADVRGAIGFSSFGVLAYYAIANASAWTLGSDQGRPARVIPILGWPVACCWLSPSLRPR
jgi:hypothetical protein